MRRIIPNGTRRRWDQDLGRPRSRPLTGRAPDAHQNELTGRVYPTRSADPGGAGAALIGYGLKGDDMVDAVQGLRSLVHGFAGLELSGGFGLPTVDRSFEAAVRTFLAASAPV